ncbi:MAG: prepilin peptidase, partial [Propionibacteriales bacterium]|nr:prepilin peptidase [Propionibacteriales bacterium]
MLVQSIAALSAAATAVLCAVGTAAIRRLPEPALESDAADKVPYAQIADQAWLPVELAAAGAVVGGLVGWRLGWEPILAGWIYLGATGVVLAYIDARTRILPTRIIAPSYAIVIVLVCLSAVLDRDTSGLVQSALGWLVMG